MLRLNVVLIRFITIREPLIFPDIEGLQALNSKAKINDLF